MAPQQPPGPPGKPPPPGAPRAVGLTPARPGAPGARPGAAPNEPAKSRGEGTSRQHGLEQARHLQQILDAAPGARQTAPMAQPASKKDAERVMKLAAGLTIRVPAGVVTEAHVDQRMRDIARSVTWQRPIAHGAKILKGDELLADIVGYLGGEAFLAKTDQWFNVEENPLLPGLFKSLVGLTVPAQRVVQVQLPPDYPVKEHAGREAVFAVSLKEARRRDVLELDDPMLLPLLNRGAKTLKQLRAQVHEELVRDRGNEMMEHARRLLLRELYQLSMNDVVPQNLVDEEVTARWKSFVGDAMIRQGVPLDEQERSRAAYADDKDTVAEARRTVWEARICYAVATAYNIAPTDAEVKSAVKEVMGDVVDLDALLYAQPQLAKDLARAVKVRAAIDALMKHAKITFDAPPTPIDAPYVPLTPKTATPTSGGGPGGSGVRPPPTPIRQPVPPPGRK